MLGPGSRWNFRIGDVFPSDDAHSRYVMRLSIAIADMRVVVRAMSREGLTAPERLFHVRQITALLREAARLVDPPATAPFPSLDELLSPFEHDEPERCEAARAAYEDIMRRLDERLRHGVTLRRELGRMRNSFSHYHLDRESDTALGSAMEAVAGQATSYVYHGDYQMAGHAHRLIGALTYPSTSPQGLDERVRTVSRASIDLILVLSDYIVTLEGLWLHTRPPGVVVRVDQDGTMTPLGLSLPE